METVNKSDESRSSNSVFLVRRKTKVLWVRALEILGNFLDPVQRNVYGIKKSTILEEDKSYTDYHNGKFILLIFLVKSYDARLFVEKLSVPVQTLR